MAGNEVRLVFAGDATSLQRTFQNVGSGADGMASKINEASTKSRNALGGTLADGIDNSERKFQGLADSVDGVGGIMQGFRDGDIVGVARGFADLAGGITDFVVPALKSVAARFGFMTAATAAQTAATGAATGAQTGLNAALLANPIGIVVASIAALVAIGFVVVKNWGTIKAAFAATWGWIKDRFGDLGSVFGKIPGLLQGIGSKVFDALTWPYRTAFNFIADAWNNTVGKLSFTVPDWVPKLGGKGFDMPDIPKFHSGGVVPGGPNSETLALLQGGERVITNGGRGGGGLTVIVQGSVITDRDLVRVIANAQRDAGMVGMTA